MHRIRVLLLSTDLQKGGLPLRLVRLAGRFASVNVEPVVGCLSPRGPLSEVLESQGIETFACDARGRFDARCLSRLAGHIRRIDPDLIHASLFHANMAARLVGRLDRSRPILTSTVTIELERRWHRAVESIMSGFSDLHAANSEAVAVHLRDELGFPSDRVVVVPNAVDFEAIDRTPPMDRMTLGISESMPFVVWVGRMDPVKNLPDWIDAVERVSRERPVHGILIGDGPERARIERMIASRQLSSFIRVMGWMDDVIGVLKSANAMLLPSLTEGSPNALLEAMCCGCPVVASDAPACVELIREAGIGDACQVGDTVSMACHLMNVLREPAGSRAAATLAAQKLRESHDFSAVLGRWRSIYDQLMSSH